MMHLVRFFQARRNSLLTGLVNSEQFLATRFDLLGMLHAGFEMPRKVAGKYNFILGNECPGDARRKYRKLRW